MLQLRRGGERPLPIGNWTFPTLVPFVESTAYGRLIAEMSRYVGQEVAGRSFLIAGHRGSGKTTTVARAIQKLSNDLLRQSINRDAFEVGQRAPLQRPLLVKLVGHSLIAKPPKLREPAPPPAEPGKDKKAAGGETAASERERAEKEDPAAEAAPADDHEGDAQGALVHITIALYRALAGELAAAYSVHALNGDKDERADRLEMAAQLAFELDSNPDPKTLRAFWSRLDRLSTGVLWPVETDPTFDKLFVFDQGMREIVAAATASQAYQVCSGQVVYTFTRKNSAGTESTIEAKGDVKEAISRLTAIGAAVIAGGVTGAASTAPSGVAAGLLVWLLGTLSLSWSTKRQRKRDESVDYQFMQDRSLETLDRDLPLVIQRIRQAGLAPVFVIDELDKLPDVDATIGAIIKRLKHLVSDHGFFCFLTDRDYYDRIQQVIAAKPYPTEHTYFSERLLVLNRPDELFEYLTKLIVSDVPGGDPFAVATVALAVIFRSRLNFTDVSRKLGELVRSDGTLKCSETDIRGKREFPLAATIQLAINRALAAPGIADRFRDDPGFAQMAVDALYWIARRWEDEPSGIIDLSQEKLRDELVSRMSFRVPGPPVQPPPAPDPVPPGGAGKPAPGPDAIPAALPPGGPAGPPADQQPAGTEPISRSDLSTLHELVLSLASSLANFPGLIRVLSAEATEPWPIADIVPRGVPGLLQNEADKPFHFRFLLDELGRPAGQAPQQQWLSPAQRAEFGTIGGRLDAMAGLLEAAGLTIADFKAAGALPQSLSDEQLQSLRALVETVSRQGYLSLAQSEALVTANSVVAAIDESRRPFEEALVLAANLARDAGCSAEDALAAAARYFDPSHARFMPGDRPDLVALIPPGRTLGDLLQRLRQNQLLAPEPRQADELIVDRRWMAWRDALIGFFAARPGVEQISYDDMLLAAMARAPGSIFRAMPAQMTIVEWSRVVLAGVPSADEPPGYRRRLWALVGGLRALGFDGRLLTRIAKDEDWEWDSLDRKAAEALAAKAPPRVAGVVHVYAEAEPTPAVPPSPTMEKPILAIGSGELSHYSEGLGWLRHLGAFEGLTREKAGAEEEELRTLSGGSPEGGGEPS